MRLGIWAGLARLARLGGRPQTTVPAWAQENTQEVEALRRVNHDTSWATESTGLLSALSAGLSSMDRHGEISQDGEISSSAGADGWLCRSGEVVEVGDVVALRHGASADLVARITGGTTEKVQCRVVGGGGFAAGDRVSVSLDQLLVKVASR